jgi:hypothetical protein
MLSRKVAIGDLCVDIVSSHLAVSRRILKRRTRKLFALRTANAIPQVATQRPPTIAMRMNLCVARSPHSAKCRVHNDPFIKDSQQFCFATRYRRISIMPRTRMAILTMVAATMMSVSFSSIAVAQDETPASTPKQIRKAQRKAARAKRNAELTELRKQGYQPGGGSNPGYPQNAQNAEKKINSAKPASAP